MEYSHFYFPHIFLVYNIFPLSFYFVAVVFFLYFEMAILLAILDSAVNAYLLSYFVKSVFFALDL